MKVGLCEANAYMDNIRSVIGGHLTIQDGIYSGKSGNLRMARECGYVLNDFDKLRQDAILSASYSRIYVIGCALKPLLDAKEWIQKMRKQIKC